VNDHIVLKIGGLCFGAVANYTPAYSQEVTTCSLASVLSATGGSSFTASITDGSRPRPEILVKADFPRRSPKTGH